MKHTQLFDVLHAESDKAVANEMLARARLDRLLAEHRCPIERKLLGVAALFHREFEYTFNHEASANRFRPIGFSARLYFLMKMGTVQSWAEVAPILEALALVGFDVDQWKTHDHAATYTRSYRYRVVEDAWDETNPERIGSVAVDLAFNLPGDTDTCRRVLKGYTERHSFGGEPEYELVCD